MKIALRCMLDVWSQAQEELQMKVWRPVTFRGAEILAMQM